MIHTKVIFLLHSVGTGVGAVMLKPALLVPVNQIKAPMNQ